MHPALNNNRGTSCLKGANENRKEVSHCLISSRAITKNVKSRVNLKLLGYSDTLY